MEVESKEIPFDMVNKTLESIRSWIDKINELSVGIVDGNKIDPNEMIKVKMKMVKQLIVLASPLIEENLEEVEEFFLKIVISKGDIKTPNGWSRKVSVYTKAVDYSLDECIQGIEKALNKYFKPKITEGGRY